MKALAVTVAILIGSLATGVGWFALQGDPMAGQPVAVIVLDPPAVSGASASQVAREDEHRRAQPILVVPIERPRQSARAGLRDEQGRLRVPPGFSVVGLDSDPETRPSRPDTAATEAGGLGPTLVAGLVQESRYGPLPRIGEDGRQPSEVYARPTRYASLPRLGEPLRIAILINGLGLSESVAADAIAKLPPAVTLAFGPYAGNLQGLVNKAREAGHEVMLQIPLEPFDYPDNDPGPHTLLTTLPHEENMQRLHWLMARFTGYTGITNHMGAKFAAAQDAFLPVLEELKSRGLIYLDDGTSARSTATTIARDMGLAFSVAQVPIDAGQSPEEIDLALARLEELARESGLAIGVGTSLPVTIERVAQWARTLEDKGAVLIPVSAAVRAQHPS